MATAQAALGTRLRARWHLPALAGLLVVGGVLLVYETRGTTFWADEWQWILTRRGGGIGTLLDPHNEHLSLVPVLIYKLLFAIVGLRHYWPYRAVVIATHLLCVALVFTYSRRRVGPYLGLVAAALIMFFGPGWQNILWPFQMGWLIALDAGIGALLLLDRRDRVGDAGACALLAVALASSGAGVAIAIGVVVDVLRRRRIGDLWIAAIPIALYALWWLGYQHATFNRHALVLLPRFVYDSAAGAISAVTGLADVNVLMDTGSFLSWGAPLLVLALVILGWRLLQLGEIPGRAVSLAAVLVGFWILTAISRSYVSLGAIVLTATGDESRYLYVGAVFLVLLVAELARGYSPSLPVATIVGVLAVGAILSNLGPLRDGSRLLQSQAQVTRAELGTMNLTRSFINPNYVSNGFIFGIVTARAWFQAENDLGSPAASARQIASFPEYARQAADSQLIKIGELAVRGAPRPNGRAAVLPPTVDALESGTAAASAGCLNFRPTVYTPAGAANAIQVTVPPNGVTIRIPTVTAMVSARRFSSQFTQLGTLDAPSAAAVDLLPDSASLPWHVRIAVDGAASICAGG